MYKTKSSREWSYETKKTRRMFWLKRERKIETRARAGNESARERSGPRAPNRLRRPSPLVQLHNARKSLIAIQSVKGIDSRMLLTRYNEDELREVGVSTVLKVCIHESVRRENVLQNCLN